MNQTCRILSTYSADTFGVASALYELGGMTIIHDASGCNSTYTTHDEPRWFDMDSMVYISGISEIEAIMGDDNKLITDIVKEVKALAPRFVAICGTPIPAMTGCDYDSIAMAVENETDVPSFGFATTGMNTYVPGAAKAFRAIVDRFASDTPEKKGEKVLNLLGATPLDFSTNGQIESMIKCFSQNGWAVNTCLAMGCDFDSIRNIGSSDVNLVLSDTGLDAAIYLEERFHTPYLARVPYGKEYAKTILQALERLYHGEKVSLPASSAASTHAYILGEAVSAVSLAEAILSETGMHVQVLCPTNESPILREHDLYTPYEADIESALKDAKLVIGDPIYRKVLNRDVRFLPLPHEAYSGRIYRKDIPNLIGNISYISEKL